jgi:hypothetical protein
VEVERLIKDYAACRFANVTLTNPYFAQAWPAPIAFPSLSNDFHQGLTLSANRDLVTKVSAFPATRLYRVSFQCVAFNHSTGGPSTGGFMGISLFSKNTANVDTDPTALIAYAYCNAPQGAYATISLSGYARLTTGNPESRIILAAFPDVVPVTWAVDLGSPILTVECID